MKKVILIFIIPFFSSCSKSLFYAYEKNNDYYSLEITSKNEEIYRAKTSAYDSIYKSPYIYIYTQDFIDVKNNNIEVQKELGYFSFSFSSIYYVSEEGILECPLYNKDGDIFGNWHKEIVNFEIREDSIVTNNRSVNLFPLKKGNDIKKERCNRSSYKDFFPPYMLKVKKIDYQKLMVEGIPKRLIKHPRKVKKRFNENCDKP